MRRTPQNALRLQQSPPSSGPVTAREANIQPVPAYAREQVARLRKQLNLSQPVFAQALNVSPETVRAWEQGKRSPDGAALRLLEVAQRHPEMLLSIVAPEPSREVP
jgi:putative transcriptional regulator